jgi:predicted GNAT family N-acyltransferase
MATPFINTLAPSASVDTYRSAKGREEQPSTVPGTFLDAMDVRMAVYVGEQGVPAEVEFDFDDSRSRHWVIYASVNKIESHEKLAEDGTVLKPRRSSTTSLPIGTLRCVPFPHPPHPIPGGKYLGSKLIEGDEAAGTNDSDAAPTIVRRPSIKNGDRQTSLHDGTEPYVKLGRLAVLKEFRGHKLASLLVKTAFQWLRSNPNEFVQSVTRVGLESLGAAEDAKIPYWDGLVCIHAQIVAIEFWKTLGFEKDDLMGTWWEDGIEHCGMFRRLEITEEMRRAP